MEEMKCLKCNGDMELGYIHDSQEAIDILTKKLKWAPGGKNLTLDLNTVKKYPITSYRCNSCGYLENYANYEDNPIIKKTVHNEGK